MAVAVSHSGWMTSPQSSKAVIGDLEEAHVAKYNLTFQSPSRPAESVLQDPDQVGLTAASISRENGRTALKFTLPLVWLTSFLEAGNLHFIWAHGSPLKPLAFPSYHGVSRGAVSLQAATWLGLSPPPLVVPPPPPASPVPSPIDCGFRIEVPVVYDYCNDTVTYEAAKCFYRNESANDVLVDEIAKQYEHTVELAQGVKLSWTISGQYPGGEISMMIQARTRGWVALGLVSPGSAAGVNHGMVDADMYIGSVSCVSLFGRPNARASPAPSLSPSMPPNRMSPLREQGSSSPGQLQEMLLTCCISSITGVAQSRCSMDGQLLRRRLCKTVSTMDTLTTFET